MINLFNVLVPLILAFGCNDSITVRNTNKDLADKSFNDSLHLHKSNKQTKQQQINGQTITVVVSYAAIACGCPQWFETRFQKQPFLKDVERFYLEPTNKLILNANDLWDGQTLPLTLKLVGRFSDKKELPKTYNTKTTTEKARIFWYDKITIVSPSKK